MKFRGIAIFVSSLLAVTSFIQPLSSQQVADVPVPANKTEAADGAASSATEAVPPDAFVPSDTSAAGVASRFIWVEDRYFELIKWDWTWDQAKADAENRGGRLACIKDAITNSAVYNQLIKGTKFAVFIGGERSNATGKWYWVDGTEISFNNWAPGQPDNNRGLGGEDAISYNSSCFGDKWNDIPKILTSKTLSVNIKFRPAYYLLELSREQYKMMEQKGITIAAPESPFRAVPSGADFSLDKLITDPEVFNLSLSKIKSINFRPSIYPDQLTFASTRKHEQNFMSYNVSEAVLSFSESKLSKAYILLSYTPDKKELPELAVITQAVIQKFDRMAEKKLAGETVQFINHEKFIVYKWIVNNAYVLLYSRPELPGAFVSIRITPKTTDSIPGAFENLKTKQCRNVSISGSRTKILPVPMIRQLPGMGACWNSTMTRQLNYLGSDIDQQIMICMVHDKKTKGSEVMFRQMGRILGYSVEYQTINKKSVEYCLDLIEKYNQIAEANKKPQIIVKSVRGAADINDDRVKGEKESKDKTSYIWGDRFNEMEHDIISKVILGDVKGYNEFRKLVISNIDNNTPIGWTVKTHSGPSCHRRMLIGYDLEKDIVYYSDPWFNCDKRSMPFPAAYCMSVWVQIYRRSG